MWRDDGPLGATWMRRAGLSAFGRETTLVPNVIFASELESFRPLGGFGGNAGGDTGGSPGGGSIGGG